MRFSGDLASSSRLSSLRQSKQSLVEQEDYSKARQISLQIQELREKERQKALRSLESQHKRSLHSVDSLFNQELARFRSNWDTYAQSLKNELEVQEAKLKEEHVTRIQAEEYRLETTLPFRYKPSASILAMLESKQKAARLDCFSTAEKLQRQIKEQQKAEREASSERRAQVIKDKLVKYQVKLARDVDILRRRHTQKLNELKKKRSAEQERFLKKYANVRQGLENSQRIELSQLRGGREYKLNRSLDFGKCSVTPAPPDMTNRFLRRYKSKLSGV